MTVCIIFPGTQRHPRHSQPQTQPEAHVSRGLWAEGAKTPRHCLSHLPRELCRSLLNLFMEGWLQRAVPAGGGNGEVMDIHQDSPDLTRQFREVWKYLNRQCIKIKFWCNYKYCSNFLKSLEEKRANHKDSHSSSWQCQACHVAPLPASGEKPVTCR